MISVACPFIRQTTASFARTSHLLPLAPPSAFCQDHNMKHLLLACLFPMTLPAQNMQQLTEQLGKTVLYGDLALSPDGALLAWVQSTAATTSRHPYIREISGNAPAKIEIPIVGERTDFDPVWSPDSRTLTFFSSAGEKAQRQLWMVKAG